MCIRINGTECEAAVANIWSSWRPAVTSLIIVAPAERAPFATSDLEVSTLIGMVAW